MNEDWKGAGKDGMFTILGASSHSEHERTERDFYATDPACMEALLKVESFSNKIWECCCGKGHLSNVLKAHGYDVRESDIVDRINNEVKDFLFMSETDSADCDIITNPPYSKAQEFVETALNCVTSGHKVAMFLKLTFLEGKSRRKMFTITPPQFVYVFSERQKCAPNGEFDKIGSSAVAYAWFVWVKGFTGEPTIRWI